MMPTFDLQLEEPCPCCCVSDYGGRTRVSVCVPADAHFGCQSKQGCATLEHWGEGKGKNRRHLSAFCHDCLGHGAIPTDFGREVLDFVARHAGCWIL